MCLQHVSVSDAHIYRERKPYRDGQLTDTSERDSAKDQAVVYIFIFATVGLLSYAAIRPWIDQWAAVRVKYTSSSRDAFLAYMRHTGHWLAHTNTYSESSRTTDLHPGIRPGGPMIVHKTCIQAFRTRYVGI
jgi:hypothetical protein